MRAFRECVFDDTIMGETTVYTATQFNRLLASTPKLVIQANSFNVAASDDKGELSVQIQVSSDGRNWLDKYDTAEINQVQTSKNAVNVDIGYDDGSEPSMPFVRLKITTSGNAMRTGLKVWVAGRGVIPESVKQAAVSQAAARAALVSAEAPTTPTLKSGRRGGECGCGGTCGGSKLGVDAATVGAAVQPEFHPRGIELKPCKAGGDYLCWDLCAGAPDRDECRQCCAEMITRVICKDDPYGKRPLSAFQTVAAACRLRQEGVPFEPFDPGPPAVPEPQGGGGAGLNPPSPTGGLPGFDPQFGNPEDPPQNCEQPGAVDPKLIKERFDRCHNRILDRYLGDCALCSDNHIEGSVEHKQCELKAKTRFRKNYGECWWRSWCRCVDKKWCDNWWPPKTSQGDGPDAYDFSNAPVVDCIP